MINKESKILKLRKVTIYGNLYAIDKDNNDLYDYESTLEGIPIKIGKLSYNPTRIILLEDSTGKTVKNNSTGKTRTKKGGIKKSKKKTLIQRGGSVKFNIGLQQWENASQGGPRTNAFKYSQEEVDALNRLGIGTIHSHGSSESYKANSDKWYIIRPGTPPPIQGTTLQSVIDQIYTNDPNGALDTFKTVEAAISAATAKREKDALRFPDIGSSADGHRAYLDALSNLVSILRTYTNPRIFTGNTEPSSSNSYDDNDAGSSSSGLNKQQRWARDRGGSRKSKKSKKAKKSKKFRKSKKKMRKSKNKRR